MRDACRFDTSTPSKPGLGNVQAQQHTDQWVGHGAVMMTHPCRFDTSIPSKPAAVAIYPDGSVLVHAAGAEVGQGLTTKVKQVNRGLVELAGDFVLLGPRSSRCASQPGCI